jgi:aldehyde:ferredoxin oxidoreductase
MKIRHGYCGKVLDVDLSNKTIVKSDLDEALVKDYMGGKGFGAKILYEQLAPRIDPLSPENILVFAGGPLTGTLAPASGRFEVCTKSPATDLWLDSNCGGFFGPELKFAGYDMMIIKGAAEKPVILVIDNDRIELKSATDLWGLDTIATHHRSKIDSERIIVLPALARPVKKACATLLSYLNTGLWDAVVPAR